MRKKTGKGRTEWDRKVRKFNVVDEAIRRPYWD